MTDIALLLHDESEGGQVAAAAPRGMQCVACRSVNRLSQAVSAGARTVVYAPTRSARPPRS